MPSQPRQYLLRLKLGQLQALRTKPLNCFQIIPFLQVICTRLSYISEHVLGICPLSLGIQEVCVAQSCLTLCDPMDLYPTRLLCPWSFPDKNTGIGSHSLLQRIFPTQGLNPGLLHCRQILYQLNHQRSPLGKSKHLPRKSQSLSIA